jgi:hypothetical protein
MLSSTGDTCQMDMLDAAISARAAKKAAGTGESSVALWGKAKVVSRRAMLQPLYVGLGPEGIQLVLAVLSQRSNPTTRERLYRSKVFELCTSQLCSLVMGPALAAEAPGLVERGTLGLLTALVRDTDCPQLARARAAQAYQVLATTPSGLAVTEVKTIAELLIYLMGQNTPLELKSIGVRGAAILAQSHKGELARAIGLLVGHVAHPAAPDVQINALKALLNLSLSPTNQILICRTALPVLLCLNREPPGSGRVHETQTYSSGILHNLSKNPKNYTEFFKAELHMKQGKHPKDLDLSDVNPALIKVNSHHIRINSLLEAGQTP